jgi:hypothetical protein
MRSIALWMEGTDILLPILLLKRPRKYGIFRGLRLGNLFVVLVVNHVFEQYGNEAPQEWPQHPRVHRRLTESAPKLARFQGHTFVTILPQGSGFRSVCTEKSAILMMSPASQGRIWGLVVCHFRGSSVLKNSLLPNWGK